MSYCKTCKHWKPTTWGQKSLGERYGLGDCGGIMPLKSEKNWCPIYTKSSYGIDYHIYTAPEFGCVLWESKDGSDK